MTRPRVGAGPWEKHMLARRIAPSADLYLQRIQALDRTLLSYVKAMHLDGRCGLNSSHRAECVALFHELGWDSFERYLAAREQPARSGT